MNLIILGSSAVLQNIRDMAVAWPDCSVDKVFYAASAGEAEAVLAEYPVHIVAAADRTDRGAEGFAFLTALSEKNRRHLSREDGDAARYLRSLVMLSEEPRFEDAVLAVRLDCADITPVHTGTDGAGAGIAAANDADKCAFIQALQRAVDRLQQQEYASGIPEHRFITERLWLSLLSGALSPEDPFVQTLAGKYDIPLYPDTMYVPVLAKIRRYSSENGGPPKDAERLLKEFCGKTIVGDRFSGCIIQLEKNQMLMLLYYRSSQDFDTDSCRLKCEEVIRYSSMTLGCDICIFVGRISSFRDLRAAIDHVGGMALNIVAYYNQVFFADSHVIPPLASVMPDTGKWSRMLLTMHPETLKREIRLYFQQMTMAGTMDGRLLSMFREDVMQMLYSLLREKDINAHEFTYDAELQALSPDAAESADNMLAFSFRAIDLVAELLKEKTVSVTEQAREYIGRHYAEDITREGIAEHFFLHPDYLDRICKKEFGCTVRQMILNVRIENACRLLLETKMPVSSIASRLGFKSPAHFSMTFRKQTGQTPKEYRQNEGRRATTSE